MEPKTKEFNRASGAALADEKIQANLLGLYGGFHQARIDASNATPNWDALQERGRAIKAHTIANLDIYLRMVEESVGRAGGKVFFAKDDEEATRYVTELALARGVKTAIKSKSMVSEEMGLNERLEAAGIEAVETDLGEYIIQLAGETPFHIIAPAIHKSREDVSELFTEKLNAPRYTDIGDLTREARERLREKFIAADMGITGANFVVAETGTLVLVTNEGNGRMCTSMPRIHVAITGMEKVVPSLEDMGIMLRLLIRSATGQRISSYVTAVTGPRKSDDEDGAEEFHLVIVDNGRSRMLADPELREALYCLRCGACLNACPVYRKVGGHSYGWVYPGPIGAVVSPMLTDMSDAKDLPYASSLCGACKEACPVKINIPRMLLYLRRQLAEGSEYPQHRTSTFGERLAAKGMRAAASSPAALGIAGALGRLLGGRLGKASQNAKSRSPIAGWTRYRSLPALAKTPFRKRWKDSNLN